jgi:hypothetical protein
MPRCQLQQEFTTFGMGFGHRFALQKSPTQHVACGSIASVRVCRPYVRSYPDSDRNSDLRARRLSANLRHGRQQNFCLL